MKKKKIIDYIIPISLPVGMFIVAELFCMIVWQDHLFSSEVDINNFLRSISISVIAGYALALNVLSGRMDLSLGGQQIIGCFIGGNIALQLGLGPAGVILLSMLVGSVAGLIGGLFFVIARIPTFVLGIGMALIYEALAVAFAPNGFQLYGRSDVTLLSESWFAFLLAAILMVIMYFVLQYSTFGLQYNAIRGSQRVSMNSGINVTKNSLICFAVCGALIALSGVLDTGYNGYMKMALNMSSTGTAFVSFIPVFLALRLQKWCPIAVGIPLSVIMFRFLAMWLTKFNLSTPANTAITQIMLLLLLVGASIIANMDTEKRYKLRALAQ